MSQQKKLEKVLDLLLSEDQDRASELLHMIIVEKARTIYESIVDEEMVDNEQEIDEASDDDEVGGDASEDFTNEISSSADDIETEEESDGEAGDPDSGGDDDFDFDDDAGSEGERLDDLEAQLAELRAEFDALMGEEMQEPNHADLAADLEDGELDGQSDDFGNDDVSLDDMETEIDTEENPVFEKKKTEKLKKAPLAKDAKESKKVDEETQFLSKVADTGQRGTAKLVGTGKNTPLGAENTKSSFTNVPARKDYGGKPVKIGAGQSAAPGKYNGESAKNETPSDNVNVKPKNVSTAASAQSKFTGGKSAGSEGTKSPLSKKIG